jgi:hypothetical protein
MMSMDGMGSMMGWMMGLGLLGWIVIIGLLIAILFVLVRLLSKPAAGGPREIERHGRYDKPLQ